MFYGPGAGGAPTASASLGDLVSRRAQRRHRARGAGDSSYADLPGPAMGEVVTEVPVSLDVPDKAGVLAAVAQVFRHPRRLLRTVRQEGTATPPPGLVTHSATDAALRRRGALRAGDRVRRRHRHGVEGLL
jgi:homoserine dehydrogenase